MKQRYLVILTATLPAELMQLIQVGTAPARELTHARILFSADSGPNGPGWVDQQIADAVEVSQLTIARIRKQHVEQRLSAALNCRAPRRVYHHELDGEHEARLIALACSQPLGGQVRWTLRLLADKQVRLEIVETISYQTVRRTPKNDLKPHLKKQWCIPPDANADVVWHREDVLDVYTCPDGPRFPQLCLDETSKQLARAPRPAYRSPQPTRAGRR